MSKTKRSEKITIYQKVNTKGLFFTISLYRIVFLSTFVRRLT